MDIFSLRASVRKPQWHFTHILSLSLSVSLIFLSRFPHSLTKRISQSIAQQRWSDVANLGLLAQVLFHWEARKVIPPLPREGKRKARVSLHTTHL